MPKYSGPSKEEIDEIIAQAHGQSLANASFDPEYHETQAARYLAYDLASEFALIKCSSSCW